jgi:membrane associated rhomboid family serine protease
VVPLRDNNPTSTTPLVTYGLLGINMAVFLFQLSLSQGGIDAFFEHWAMIPAQLTQSFRGALQAPAYEWVTLVSSQFLHGGFFHLGGNLLYLWVFGNSIEDRLGHLKFLLFYLSCGALAGLVQWVFRSLLYHPYHRG